MRMATSITPFSFVYVFKIPFRLQSRSRTRLSHSRRLLFLHYMFVTSLLNNSNYNYYLLGKLTVTTIIQLFSSQFSLTFPTVHFAYFSSPIFFLEIITFKSNFLEKKK